MKKGEYVSMMTLKQTLPYLAVVLTILYIFMRIYKSYNPFAFPGIEERISLILVPCLFLTFIFYFPFQRIVNLSKAILNILREKVQKPTFTHKVFKLKFPEKSDIRKIISSENYQKELMKYLFLVFLIIIAFPFQRIVNLSKVILNILREKVQKPKFVQKRAGVNIFKLNFAEKFNIRKIISSENYQKALIEYLFLVFLIIIALLELEPVSKYLSFLTGFKTHLLVLTIVFGVVSFWLNRDKFGLEEELEEEEEIHPFIMLFLILIIGFAVQLYIANFRWVGTDEGRLLYDSKLILLGKIPFKDFFTRAPLLVYILAFFQKISISGPSIIMGRMVSVLSLCGTAIILFFIGKSICNYKIGLLSALFYLFSPFIYLSTQVRTQPLQVFLISLFIYFLIKGVKKDAIRPFILSGIFLGLGILVRKSALIFLFSLPLLLLIYYYEDFRKLTKIYCLITIPCGVIVSVIFGYFIFASGDLKPFLSGVPTGLSSIPLDITITRLKTGLKDILFFIPFVCLFIFSFCKKIKNIPLNFIFIPKHLDFSYAVPIFWLLSISSFYTYLTIGRSFWAQYFIEFLPAMCLMAAIITLKLVGSFNFKKTSKNSILSTLVVLLIVVIIPGLLFGYSHQNAYSDSPRYDQEVVKEISNYIKDHTSPNEEILCGSPIWVFMADRRVVFDESHPRFDNQEEMKNVEEYLVSKNVKFIVDDGKMKGYFENYNIKQLIKSDYYTVKEIKTHFWKIRILERIE